jgi:hypothetical protein
MITKFKIFESINKPMKVDDYVIVKCSIKGEIQNIIMQIVEIIDTGIHKGVIRARKLNEGINFFVQPYQIQCWSEDLEDLEVLLKAEKYNL